MRARSKSPTFSVTTARPSSAHVRRVADALSADPFSVTLPSVRAAKLHFVEFGDWIALATFEPATSGL